MIIKLLSPVWNLKVSQYVTLKKYVLNLLEMLKNFKVLSGTQIRDLQIHSEWSNPLRYAVR